MIHSFRIPYYQGTKFGPAGLPGIQFIWAIYYKSLTWFKAILGGIPLLNYHLGWPTGGKGRYKLPRIYLDKLSWFTNTAFSSNGFFFSLLFTSLPDPLRKKSPPTFTRNIFWFQFFWLVVSTQLKNISQTGNLPQIAVKIKTNWVATTQFWFQFFFAFLFHPTDTWHMISISRNFWK